MLWNFTILGEAASKLGETAKAQFPQIAWSRPIGLRHRIVHGYWSIELDILLTTARSLLPSFTAQLRDALAQVETPSDDHGE